MIDTKKITANGALMTLIFTVPSFIATVASGRFPVLIAYVYFYAPILWFAWIGSVIKSRNEKNGLLLTVAWLAIDLTILAALCSAAKDYSANFMSGPGNEIVFVIAYFPVIFPMGLVLYPLNLVTTFETQFHTSGLAVAFGAWLDISIIAAVQSLLIFVITRFIAGRLRTQNEQPEP